VQTHLKNRTIAGESSIKSNIWPEAVYGVIKEIQPLIASRGVATEALSSAFEESLLEIGERSKRNPAEEIRSRLIGLILWKLFGREAAFWINAQTKAGNQVPLDLLVAAYSVRKNASILARKHSMDSMAAAKILIQVTHDAADLIANNKRDSESAGIRDACHYIYTAYVYSIRRIVANRGPWEMGYIDIDELVTKQDCSDEGAFLEVLDAGILCRELLNAMQPRGRSVAIARYILGYSWPETADSLGTSINAAQKALSIGIRKAFEICMQELPGAGSLKAADINISKLKKKKTRFWRKMLNDNARR
jgi:DNA-directed RNA polymerase specialized sigma24 family protein